MKCFITIIGAFLFPTAALQLGPISDEILRQQTEVVWSRVNDRLSVFHDQQHNLTGVQVTYPAGAWGSKDSGAQIMFKLPEYSAATCEYQVFFEPGFDFVKGGKLPGLAGGNANSGGETPDGGGWSARFMWRRNGKAVLYLYHLDQESDFGDDLALGCTFQPGKWHRIKQAVTVNTAGNADGRIQVWFDNQLVLDRQNLRLQTHDRAKIDRFYFSTFFGGSGADWAPARTQTVKFANFKIERF